MRIDEVTIRGLRLVDEMIQTKAADENAGGRARHPFQRQAGIFKRLPGHFQQQTLLRIEHRRLARRDAKGQRIELPDVRIQRRGLGRIALAGPRRVFVKKLPHVPAILLDRTQRVAAF